MTAAQVKSQALTSSAVDTAYISKYILFTQRKYFRNYLGVDFYDELITQVDTTFTSDNETLVNDYIMPCLAHYVVYESLPQIRNQIAKGGVYNPLSETGDVASDLDYSRMRDDYLSKAEAMKEEITIYITAQQELDSTKYPLFCGKTSQSGGIIFY